MLTANLAKSAAILSLPELLFHFVYRTLRTWPPIPNNNRPLHPPTSLPAPGGRWSESSLSTLLLTCIEYSQHSTSKSCLGNNSPAPWARHLCVYQSHQPHHDFVLFAVELTPIAIFSKSASEYYDPCQDFADRSLRCMKRNPDDRDMCHDYFQYVFPYNVQPLSLRRAICSSLAIWL